MIGPRLVLLAFAASLVSVPAGAVPGARHLRQRARLHGRPLRGRERGARPRLRSPRGTGGRRLPEGASAGAPRGRARPRSLHHRRDDRRGGRAIPGRADRRHRRERHLPQREARGHRGARDLVGDVRPRGAGPVAAPGRGSGAAHGPVGGWSELDGGARVEDSVVVLPARDAVVSRTADFAGNHVAIDLRWKGLAEFRVDIGGLTLQTWDGVLVLFGRGDDGLELAMAPSALPNDSGAVLHLRLDGADALVLDSVEMLDGSRLEVDGRVPLTAAPERLSIRALGRRSSSWRSTCAIRTSCWVRTGSSGSIARFAAPRCRASTPPPGGWRPPSGPAAFDGSKGVSFLTRDRRPELQAARNEGGQGRFATRSGEAIAVRRVIYERGRFILRSPYAEGPIEVPFEDLHEVRMPLTVRGRGARSSACPSTVARRWSRGSSGWSEARAATRCSGASPASRRRCAEPSAARSGSSARAVRSSTPHARASPTTCSSPTVRRSPARSSR